MSRAPATSASSGPVRRACDRFSPHVFLVSERCRDCDQLAADHPQIKTKTVERTEENNSESLVANQLFALSFRSCNEYAPHGWIYGRCRDCGKNQESHQSIPKSAAAQPQHIQILSPTAAKAGSSASSSPTSSSSASTPVSNGVSISSPLLPVYNYTPIDEMADEVLNFQTTQQQAQSSSQQAFGLDKPESSVDSAERILDSAVAHMMIVDSEFRSIIASEKSALALHHTTQLQYDTKLQQLQLQYQQKENELKKEVEKARKQIEEEKKKAKVIEKEAAKKIEKVKEAAKVEIQQAKQTKPPAAAIAVTGHRKGPSSSSSSGDDSSLSSNFGATARANFLSSILSRLLTHLEEGRIFSRYLASSLSASSSSSSYLTPYLIWIAKLPSNDSEQDYALYWSREKDGAAGGGGAGGIEKKGHPTRAMHLRELKAMVMGKQTAVFLKQSSLLSSSFSASSSSSSASSSRCFSLIGNSHSLHLECASDRDCETFAYGIAALSKQIGGNPQVFEIGKYPQAGGGKQGEEKAIQMEVAQEKAEAEGNAVASSSAPSASYEFEFSLRCVNLPALHQNYIVCLLARSTSSASSQFVVLDQTERCSVKSPHPTFKRNVKCKLTTTTISEKKFRFNVYDVKSDAKTIEDTDRLGSVVMTLQSENCNEGKEFIFGLSHKEIEKNEILIKNQAAVIVKCVKKTEISVGKEKGKGDEKLEQFEKILTSGANFTRHLSSSQSAPCTIYFRKSASSSASSDPDSNFGSLYVASSVSPTPEILHLRRIRDVLVGIKPANRDRFPSHCTETNCVSFIWRNAESGETRLDLEAASKAVRDNWAVSVIGLLKSAQPQKK